MTNAAFQRNSIAAASIHSQSSHDAIGSATHYKVTEQP
jgi:hypothetical protein